MPQPHRFTLNRRSLLLGTLAFGSCLLPARLRAQMLALPLGGDRTARAIAAAVRDGFLTAEAALATALDRQAVTEQVNAFTELRAEAALAVARGIDAARDGGAQLGALAGVPLGIKDNIDIAGWPTAAGTPALATNIAQTTAPSVVRLLEAGAVIVGKTNMHELALGGTSSNAHTGPVRNPYDLARVPGGSSGGTGAAIAAGIIPAGLGTDSAGSVRIPAAFCGCVGYRPSLPVEGPGVWAAQGVPLSPEFDIVGPMARDMEDIILLNEVVTGTSLGPATLVSGMRLGIPQSLWANLDPAVAEVCAAARARLKAAGVEFVEMDLDDIFESARSIFRTLATVDGPADLAAYLESKVPNHNLDSLVAIVASADVKQGFLSWMAAEIAPKDIAQARGPARAALVDAFQAALDDAGVSMILYPTMPMLPPLVREGGDQPGDTITVNGEEVSARFIFTRNTMVAPLLRAPAISLPAGRSPIERLPVGMDLCGLPGSDERLLSAALALEKILKG